jgi:MarR family 2-MHQ and catechol resistance regulon transcriptional repressor
MRAADSVRARLEPHITRHGVTTTQFGVLEALHHVGPMNHRNLGSKLLVSKGNVTVVVDNLERRGLVKRVADAQDRRQTIVHLTPAGRRLIRRMFPQQASAIVKEFSVLTVAELTTLARLCRRLGRQEGRGGRGRGTSRE